MLQFLLVLRDIVLLRRGPQDLPHSPHALRLIVIATIIFGGVVDALLGDSSDLAMVRMAVGIGLSLGLIYLALKTREFQARFTQTAMASLLVAVLATVLLVPGLALLGPLPEPGTRPEALGGAQLLLMLLLSAIGIWKLIVDAHILRHALEVRLLFALPIAFAMELAVDVMVIALFGKSGG